ncbi:hypothetical protein [Pseudoroseicyclus sp. CXY001]|uniref:hypothetical protein n=1 Tax=Pseudoroseicyclus sp. CXY001 TaxID=3242492 RepID=UPI0035710905
MKQVLAPLLALLPGAAFALGTADCDMARLDVIPEPWEDYTATFANGDVRVAAIDFMEPVTGPMHLVIVSPPRDELGFRQCRTIMRDEIYGWSWLEFSTLDASYDPAKGLVFTIEGDATADDGFTALPVLVTITLNQSTGEITVGETPR